MINTFTIYRATINGYGQFEFELSFYFRNKPTESELKALCNKASLGEYEEDDWDVTPITVVEN